MTEQELADISINVMPDGRGLPKGEGSVAEGELLYSQKCMACHGEGGVGNSAEQLAGAVNDLSSEWPEKTIGSYWPYVTTLFDFTRRSMPMTQPGSLDNNEVYALVAYLLFLNNLVPEHTVMNRQALIEFEMPNRDGFINIHEQNKKSGSFKTND